MGSICAYEIARQTNRYAFPGITLFTFGSPRVANLFFNQELGDMAVNSWRITHARDIVPHVPFQSLGFYHHSREVWFPDKQYVPGNYNICDGSGEDPVCQDSLWFATSVEDHLNYIGVQLGRGGCIFPGPGPVVDSWNVEAVDKR
uniref:Fungal lipase-type domain-containing protein n=2 Tax=Amorphochlora amoebiformis TaxID=1561963 RepID=A0A7S0D813_9EUKA|mmetsp:Transcript_19808/g.31428  ORF Transcript_19808/g.31428 Transcript_19808/m.31428 type:complete len:145 (+) Transcript_19808:328-762(+)